MTEQGRSFKKWLFYLGYRLLGAAIEAVPEPIARAGGATGGLLAFRFAKKTRAVVEAHVEKVFGTPLSKRARSELARATFLAYARYWVESARVSSMSAYELECSLVSTQGIEHLKKGMREGNGVILALAHLGSWELGGAWLALHGMPMTSVAERLEPPAMFEWFVRRRRKLGLTILALGADSVGKLSADLSAGRLVGLLSDRDITGNGIEVELFGEKTSLAAGPAVLALRTGAVLLPAAIYHGPGREHHGIVLPPLDTARRDGLRKDAARVTKDLAKSLEYLVRQGPDQWYLFQRYWPSDPSFVPGDDHEKVDG